MLCLGKERKMLASKEIVSHEKRHQEFRDTYTNPSIQQLTTTFRTWTDSHIFNVFRNAPITLRILIICESYPFLFVSLSLFYICAYSTYSLYSGLILVLTCFLFYPHCYSRCGRLLSYSLSKGGCSLLVHIRPYSIFYFSITGYFYFRRVVRNDSLVRRLRKQRSRPCAVGRLGTIERRRTVTVFVKLLLESLFFRPGTRK